MGCDPKFLFSDPPFLANLAIWGLLAIAVLYQVPVHFIEMIT